MSDVDPIAVLLATSGTRGDRLLFQYPFNPENSEIGLRKNEKFRKNPYGVKLVTEDIRNYRPDASVKDGILAGFSPAILANLLAVKLDLCSQKFDIKIDNVRFVGFPMVLNSSTTTKQSTGKASHKIISFNIAFALKSNVSPSVIGCYSDLAKQLTVSVHHEEKKRQYLSTQAKIMISLHDEVAAMPEDSLQSPYSMILSKSPLAKDLKSVYDSLCKDGVVNLHINNWVEISFCLPHKIHVIPAGSQMLKIEPEVIQKCLEALRPYHGILFLEEKNILQESLPIDCTPALSRLISVASPLRSLQTLALEADLSLSQVFQLVSHLVYWAKATVIYPLCETNAYVLSPQANTLVNSKQGEEFVEQFPGLSLPVQLSEFSYPTQLRETRDLLDHPKQQDLKVRMVVWMLQHRLIIQLHNYVFFIPPVPRRKKKISDQLSCMSGQMSMPIVPEEASCDAIINDAVDMNKASSFSDVASVNSDESLSMGLGSGYTSQFSKSPSSEIASDSSLVSEEVKGHWTQHDGLLSNMSKEERECVLNVPAAKNVDDLRLFGRLCPYFNGRHHIEEIMYYENLHRSQLLMLIDKFREVLQICQYQDPATVLNTG